MQLKIAIKKHQIHTQQARYYYKLCVQILSKPQQLNYLDKNQLSTIPAHKQLKKWHKQYTKTAVQGKLFILNKDNTTQINYLLASYLGKLQTQAQSYVFVSEQGYVHNRLKQRQPRQLFLSNHLGGLYV